MKRVLALALLVLTGCGDATGPEAQLRVLERQELCWRAQGITNYDFDLTSGSAWVPDHTWRIEVRGNAVKRVIDLSSGGELALYAQASTLDSLFAHARHDLTAPVEPGDRYVLTLEFHPIYGFLTTLNGDIPRSADDEYWMSVSNFVRR